MLLEPLPYSHPEQIVQVMEMHPDGQRHWTSTLTFLDWKNQNTVFEAMAAEWWDSMALTGGDVPVELASLMGICAVLQYLSCQTLARTHLRAR